MRQSSLVRRWWLPVSLAVVALVAVGAKLGVRSAATGEAVLPGVAGAPVIGPQPTATATPGPNRIRVRVQVRDAGDQPVAQAIVEVRDRFNAVAAVQETGLGGDVVVAVPANSGYIVTARKQGLAQGRVDGVTVVATPAGQQPPIVSVRLEPGVAVVAASAQGGPAAAARLYVGHNSPRLSLIDASSNLLLKHSDPLGQGRLTLMAPSQDHKRVYATWNGSPNLLVLNSTDLSLEREVNLNSGGITSLALHPQNGRLWVATFAAESAEASVLLELDGASLDVMRRMSFNQSSSGLRFIPDGSLLYVRHRTANLLSIVDPITATVRNTVRLPQWPTDMALSSDGRSLYVVNLGSERLMELDATTGEPRRSIEIGTGAYSVVAHPDGQRLFVVNQMLGYVQMLNAATGQVDDLVPVGRAPQGVALSADARSLYVANSGAGTISLVDLDGKRVRDTLNTGGTPSSLLLI